MENLPIIHVSRMYHRGAMRMMLRFKYNDHLIQKVKTIPGARWSDTYRSWYIPDQRENIRMLHNLFTDLARIEHEEPHVSVLPEKQKKRRTGRTDRDKYRMQITPQARKQLEEISVYLKSFRFSEQTMANYLGALEWFFGYIRKDITTITQDDIIRFQAKEMHDRKYSDSTQRQFLSALKHMLKYYQVADIEPEKLSGPRKSRRLPSVLSRNEVMMILGVIKNMKHFVVISLLYSSGLRIGELLRIKIEDISKDRRQLFVRQSKGKKDRYVGISHYLLPVIEHYIIKYKPKVYLFNGQKKLTYSPTSVRKALKKAVLEAGITKRVTPHILRHSYATHQLEDGIDIRYIQELLGHAKPETTMIYTHVTTKQLTDIQSPLDGIIKKLRDNENNFNQKFLLSGDIP